MNVSGRVTRLLKSMLLIMMCGGLPANALADAEKSVLKLSRKEVELQALKNSNQLKSFVEMRNAAEEQTDAQYAKLFPRLTFDAYYNYLSAVPQVQTAAAGTSIPFGSHDNYSFGPSLSYTLWDTNSERKAYRGLGKLTESRDRDRRDEELQVYLAIRMEYVRVQALVEELRAVNDSLNLARSQNDDIVSRLRAGGATKLDRVESERAVLSYEIQFEQKQAELSTALKDLLARTQIQTVSDISHPGPAGIPNVTLVLDLDPIQKNLEDLSLLQFSRPDDNHPKVSSRELLAQSAELQSESIKASLWPTFKFLGRVTLQYPNGPNIEQVNQNTLLFTATVPLFEMNETRHRSGQKMREAEAARYQKDQVRIDLRRDYDKAQELLASLRVQYKLAVQDVKNSSEAARLYYESYRGGKSQLIDVQTANNRALISKVNKTRIEAQILNQLDQLRALSGREAL